MASLRLIVLVLSTLLAVTGGFLVGYEELAGLVNVSETVIATTISDYYAQINSGGIVAYTLNLTGPASAATADFADLFASNVTTEDLTALNSWIPIVNAGTLRNTGNASFDQSVTIQGQLTVRGQTNLGDVEVLTLTATNQTEVSGIIFAQTSLHITEGLTVDGNTRIFGDVLFNSSLGVAENLSVNDQVQVAGDLNVQNDIGTFNLTVQGTATLGSFKVAEWVNVSGSAQVAKSVNATNGQFAGRLSADMVNIQDNFSGAGSLSVGEWLTGVKSANLNGNLNVNGNENVANWVTVDGTASFARDLAVKGSLSAGVNVLSGATLSAVDAMFSTLSVDTGSLETLTATFVTATNLVATDATIGKSFMSGVTTLDTLVVTDQTTLTSATANSIDGQVIHAGNATISDLTVTQHGEFENVNVKTLITSGNPSVSAGVYGAFDAAQTDSLKLVELMATNGDVTNATGKTLNYTNLYGTNLWLTLLESNTATIQNANITNGTITNLASTNTFYSELMSNVIDYDTLDASYGWLTTVDALATTSVTVTATNSTIDSLLSTTIDVMNLKGTTATVDSLMATRAWLDNLMSTTGTFANLWSTTTTAVDLKGMQVTYDTGDIAKLTSTTGVTQTFDVKQTINSGWLWAREVNATTLEAKSLHVSGDSWLQNVTVRGDLWVEGETTLQNGTISGNTVVASLDVVQDSELLGWASTGTSFLTDLSVKRVTITSDFQANEASLGTSSITTLRVTNSTIVDGFLDVRGDSSLSGNLVVVGTTQFQTGSFSRIGTALITTTDMEAFNLNAAEGTFGEIAVSDFNVNRAVVFDRSIALAPLLGDVSGATNSLFIQIAPSTFTATARGVTFPVNTLSYLHTGNASIDALVVATAANQSVAGIRFKGDGSIDLLDGDILFDELDVAGGIEFENENNIAYPTSAAVPDVVLSQGASGAFYSYSNLQDRDLGAPGARYTPTRFAQPTGAGDLITLQAGHYRVSGSVYFAPNTTATTSIVAIAQAAVSAWSGTASNSSVNPSWTASCVASFNLVAGSTFGGSCSFTDLLRVPAGQTMTLRTSASWPFSSAPSTDMIKVDARSNVQIAEYFERSSEGL